MNSPRPRRQRRQPNSVSPVAPLSGCGRVDCGSSPVPACGTVGAARPSARRRRHRSRRGVCPASSPGTTRASTSPEHRPRHLAPTSAAPRQRITRSFSVLALHASARPGPDTQVAASTPSNNTSAAWRYPSTMHSELRTRRLLVPDICCTNCPLILASFIRCRNLRRDAAHSASMHKPRIFLY